MMVRLLLLAPCLLLASCASQSRWEVLGVVRDAPPAPSSGMQMMEIPIADGETVPSDAPIVTRNGHRYLVVAVDRQEVWRSQGGLVLPEKIWTGRQNQPPSPAIGAAMQASRLRDEIDALQQQLAHEKQHGTAVVGDHESLARIDAIQQRVAGIKTSLDAFQASSNRDVPSLKIPGERVRKSLSSALGDLNRVSMKVSILEEVAPRDPLWEPKGKDDAPGMHPDLIPLIRSLQDRLAKISTSVDDGRVDLVSYHTKALFQSSRDLSSDPLWVRHTTKVTGEDEEAAMRRWTMVKLLMGIRSDSASALSHIAAHVVDTSHDDPSQDVIVAPY